MSDTQSTPTQAAPTKCLIVDATGDALARLEIKAERFDRALARAAAAAERPNAAATAEARYKPKRRRGQVRHAGRYWVGKRIAGGRYIHPVPIAASSRRAAKRIAREAFGPKAIVTPAA